MARIELFHVTKRFGASVIAVDDLCLEIADQHFVCLLGPSGCGKTTTLRMIAGLEDPTSGEIRLKDQVLSSSDTGEMVPPEQRGMGLVFQSYALWPHMTVSQNIAFGLQMQRHPRDVQVNRVKELLLLLHIEGLGDRYPLQLSGGQQQRVALARMLAIYPEVLLLDEPLSNLDARLRMEMRAELKRLHEQIGNTIVYVTHDQLEAMTLATEIAVMCEGRLQQFGPPMEIYRKPTNTFVAEFVGSPTMNFFWVDDSPTATTARSILKHLLNQRSEIAFEDPENTKQIGLRPEAINLVKHDASLADGVWSCAAIIEAILPTGSEWIIRLRVDDSVLFMRTDEDPQFKSQDRGKIAVRADCFHLFDAHGQRLSERL
ncbi:MAG: ATP-binding cassette domain-containing protein [Anaerolineales bacterium]|nr:ATP-binding cassette domain-containing protein [Anaerolineales bacterium]